MTLTERFAKVYGPRPVQIIDAEMDRDSARKRRALIGLATYRADSLLQVQAIYLSALIFGLLTSPTPIAIAGYCLFQLSELHGLIVFRALMKDAQDPKASLDHHKRPVVWYGIWFTVAASIVLVLFYTMTPAEWYLGVLAAAGLGAAYFIPSAKHDAFRLYFSLTIFFGAMFVAVPLRAYLTDDLELMQIGPPLALVLFLTVTGIAVAMNERIEYFKRLDNEELIDHAFAELRAESRAKSALLARIGHEIRTPLNGVLGTAALLEAKVEAEDQIALVKVMRESGDNLLELLNRLLDVSAAEIDAISIRPTPTKLDALVREEVALFAGQAAAAGMQLTLEEEFCNKLRLMDEVRVRQCLANLIANAITHSGGDKIVITCVSASDDVVTMTVSDNGCGIAENQRADIFRIFGGKDLGSDPQSRGVGLGLALTRSIARALGGELTVSGVHGLGATFILRIAAPTV